MRNFRAIGRLVFALGLIFLILQPEETSKVASILIGFGAVTGWY